MQEQGMAVRAAALALLMALAGCASEAPKPATPKNISAPLKAEGLLPPGVSAALKAGDAVALKAPTSLRLTPLPNAEAGDLLPAGTLVRLKSRVLNARGSWWLVDAPNASGWVVEAELLKP